jgi:EAL domain-containing protein (putative c-di-GMP-specific phosphodiesterase class I)
MDFVSLVKSSLQRSQATPTLLEIEITESLAMRDSAMAADRLRRLAEMGVSIAVDDFGTGYSNLASLIRLPISRLKIDRSLLDDFTVRPEARILVQTIISMANSLGFHSVAEGVEDADQLALLCDMGCDVVQGYHLSRPVDEATLAAFVFDQVSPPSSAARLARAAG